jgi:hypothetical protein
MPDASAVEVGAESRQEAGQDAPVAIPEAAPTDSPLLADPDAGVLRGCLVYVTGGLPVTYDLTCPAMDAGAGLTIAWQGNECSPTQPPLPEPACVTGEACTVTYASGTTRDGTCL